MSDRYELVLQLGEVAEQGAQALAASVAEAFGYAVDVYRVSRRQVAEDVVDLVCEIEPPTYVDRGEEVPAYRGSVPGREAGADGAGPAEAKPPEQGQ